ncbi:MAG: NUDIX hydrolase [Planctomycetes bacterium]|nr:NUDIX hydrolase [Planctomycetota bacterium]
MGRHLKAPGVSGERLLASGRFASLKILDWIDARGIPRKWESVERVGVSGAVLIAARLLPSDRLLLIRQFRPPARREVVEFPAGLMDGAETAEEAARRELREETGYQAARLDVFPPAFTTPGLSNESVYLVAAEIDEEAPENISPNPDFDDSEIIQTVLVERTALLDFYRRESARGVAFDAKLVGYILGMRW